MQHGTYRNYFLAAMKFVAVVVVVASAAAVVLAIIKTFTDVVFEDM
jgi:hypothetical protein